MAVSANRLYLGGRFSQVDGVARENLAAVDATTGELDRGFDSAASNPGLIPSGRTRLADADEPVRSLALAGGHLVVGGLFGAIGARRRAGLAAVRLDSGAVDETFAPGPTSGGRGVLMAAGDRLYVSRYIGSAELAAIDPVTGSRVPGFKAPENLWVQDLALIGNRLVVAANSGPALSRIRVVDALTGKSNKRFDARVGGSAVNVAASQDHLYAGGGFVSAGGASRTGLAAIDARTGALDQRFRPAGDYEVHGLITTSRRLYVAGAHWRTSATAARGGGSPRRRRTSGLNALNPITGRRYASFQAPLSWAGAAVTVLGDTVYATELPARLSAFDARTGAQRRAFHAQLPGSVVALAGARHRLYAGLSAVATPLGLPIPGVVAVDPATGRPDPTFAPGLRAIAPAAGTRALALTRDTLYVSGDFSSSRLGPATVALDPRTGQRRPGFGRRLMASALTLDQHQLYAATANASGDYRLVKLPSRPGKAHTALTGFDGPVCALVGAAGQLYAGGAFDSIAGQPVPNFAGLSLQTLHYL
jgi:outer membrane protein assembly factor BamB